MTVARTVRVLPHKRRLLEVLQWFGVLGAALAWTSLHVLGFGVTQAVCGAGGRNWGLDNDAWQIGLAAGAGAIILAAEGAAVAVFLGTRGHDPEGGDPPFARMRFFAIAAMVTNLLFLAIVVLDAIGSIAGSGCRQS